MTAAETRATALELALAVCEECGAFLPSPGIILDPPPPLGPHARHPQHVHAVAVAAGVRRGWVVATRALAHVVLRVGGVEWRSVRAPSGATSWWVFVRREDAESLALDHPTLAADLAALAPYHDAIRAGTPPWIADDLWPRVQSKTCAWRADRAPPLARVNRPSPHNPGAPRPRRASRIEGTAPLAYSPAALLPEER